MKRKLFPFSFVRGALFLALFVLAGCGVAVKYSLSGASIPPDAKTFSVAYFPNNATMVSPIQAEEGGDFAFEGEITNYTSTTAAVTSGTSNDYASLNRLTITVKVRFTNAVDEKMSFNKSFSAYADYSAEQLLTEAEGTLIPEIVDQLVTDIFQAAASNW